VHIDDYTHFVVNPSWCNVREGEREGVRDGGEKVTLLHGILMLLLIM